jgi:predicted DNA-binding transcriptional regulator YafY
MNRMDRLFALELHLQANGMLRAQDLAETLAVSVRTIYRDVEALCEAGVPIRALPGQGYALTEGYFLPPLMFTDLEAGALALGTDSIARTLDAPFRAAALSAQAKLANALTAEPRRDLRQVQEAIGTTQTENLPSHRQLRELREAIVARAVLRITYHAYGRPTPQELMVEPYGLLFYGQAWQLLAYSRERRAPHMFRLDRIDSFEGLDQHPGHKTFAHSTGAPPVDVEGELRIVVRVPSHALQLMLEQRPPGLVDELREGDYTILAFAVADADRLVCWLMKWAGSVEVLSPVETRRRMHQLGALAAASSLFDPDVTPAASQQHT